jgi:hypothetical protein
MAPGACDRVAFRKGRRDDLHRISDSIVTSISGLQPTTIDTKFFRLRQAVPLGHVVDGWRVCWLGGWDRSRVLFVVMAWKRVKLKR